MGILTKIIGSKNDRELKKLQPKVSAIGSLESSIAALSDTELAGKTAEFRQRLENGASLDSLMVEAFAVVREAGKRVLKMRHYDVQLIGGMVLHSGRIAEMRTGEGKTLVATLPAYLNALSGKGVHVVTVNDYLANRDAEWMGKVFRFLGMSVGTIVHGYDDRHKLQQYACDITYGTNSEFGFDYLRDNMKERLESYVQTRGLNYAIIDEVDSILIDEARTPLIISGPSDRAADKYPVVNEVIARLKVERDFTVEEKSKRAIMTEEGVERVEGSLRVGNLYAAENAEWAHHVDKALQAHACYKRDVDYLVNGGEVMIIDENTGRTMEGRRWSDGLHQAIEAKEGVEIKGETVTHATVTYQNFYRMYDKLSGMTGTAETEAEEFDKIYSLDVVVIPTNKPLVRDDREDMVYRTEREKFGAVVEDIAERHARGQPILVGTRNVDKSEVISRLLTRHGIPHITLNAKYHRQEGEIIAQAGQLGAVTISTNMAGRGTDILLGGNAEYLARADVAHEELGERANDPAAEQRILAEFRWLSGSPESIPRELVTKEETNRRFRARVAARAPEDDGVDMDTFRKDAAAEAEAFVERIIGRYAEHLARHEAACSAAKKKVLEVGGLHVLGTERHESRRVDNQLRGRAGRQGDPGSSQFFLSLEDDLMRIFIGERMAAMMERLGMEEGVPIEARMVSKSIQNAQKRVEGHNFDIRKNLLEYDDVMNLQRKTVYALRRKVIGDHGMEDELYDLAERVVRYEVAKHCPPKTSASDWDLDGLRKAIKGLTGGEFAEVEPATRLEELAVLVYGAVERAIDRQKATLGEHHCVVGGHIVAKAELDAAAKIKEPVWRHVLRIFYRDQLDMHWRDHLGQMDHLRDGISLRGYSSKDPKVEFKREGHEMFTSMMREVDHNVLGFFSHVVLRSAEELEREEEARRRRREQMAALARTQGGHENEVADSVAPAMAGASAGRGSNGAGRGAQTKASPAKKIGSQFKKTSKKGKRKR